MDLQHLPDVHTGRHTQRVQYDVQRTSVWKEWHILNRKHTGHNTLVTVTAGHLITYRDLSLLGNIDADCLIHTGGQLIAVLSCKYFCIHNDTVLTVRNLQGSITYFTGLLTENSTEQPLFRGQLCLSLRSYFTDQDITCADLRTDTNDSTLVQVF